MSTKAEKKRSGFTNTVSKFHDRLALVMAVHRNRELSTAEIKKIVRDDSILKVDEKWIQPTDHCITGAMMVRVSVQGRIMQYLNVLHAGDSAFYRHIPQFCDLYHDLSSVIVLIPKILTGWHPQAFGLRVSGKRSYNRKRININRN
jgi:hypothetical protein